MATWDGIHTYDKLCVRLMQAYRDAVASIHLPADEVIALDLEMTGSIPLGPSSAQLKAFWSDVGLVHLDRHDDGSATIVLPVRP